MVKIYLISDIHVNYQGNWDWIVSLHGYEEDTLV